MRLTKRRWAIVGVFSVTLMTGVVAVRLLGGGGGTSATEQPAEILALDAATGAIVWSAHPRVVFLGGGSFGPDGLLVHTERFGHGCDQVAAAITFDPATGRQTSEQEEEPFDDQAVEIRVRNGSTQFTAHNPPESDPSRPGAFLNATDKSTGKKLWTFHLAGGRRFSSALVASDGVVVGDLLPSEVTEANKPYLEAFDALTGRELWKNVRWPGLSGGFALADGQLYVPLTTSIVALDARTGVERWDTVVAVEREPSSEGGVLSLAAGDGIVAVAGKGKAAAYDAMGRERWTTSLRTDRPNSMLGEGAGKVYVGTDGWSEKFACLGD